MTAAPQADATKIFGYGMRASVENPCAFSLFIDPKFDHTEFSREILTEICGKTERLIVVLPPSHGKSRIVTDALTWLLGKHPSHKVTLASWGDSHGQKTVRAIRDRVAQCPKLKLVFPRLRLPPKPKPSSDFMTDQGGAMCSIRVGESVPLCDMLLIDDPIQNYAEAASAVTRSKVWDWYMSAAYTRLNVGGRIVLVCSRTHDDDLAGRLIAQGGWKVLHYPAITNNEALWSRRVPIDYLRKTEAAIGAPQFRAMYQGEPDKADGRGSTAIPRRESFREFLELDAMVPGGSASRETRGTFTRFTLEGREALNAIVDCIDRILSEGIKDAQISLAGGAQYGKSVLQQALMAYSTGQLFRNVMTFLPSEDLVSDLVQTKFRPNVVDQMPWFASMLKMGQITNESGKTVNRIGVYSVTDGIRKATGMFCGLNKVPTTHSADVALVDEVDDVNASNEKFVAGRLTTSDLRLIFKAGTQRVHGRGMNKAWKDGSQGVVEFTCTQCEHAQNPEDNFPKIVCLRETDATEPARLTYAGDFRRWEDVVAGYDKSDSYFLGCIKCGAELDRRQPSWRHKRQDQIRLENWSFRVSQLSIAAIDLGKIVNDWRLAVESDQKMLMFRTDVLAIPKSTAQKLDPEIMDRSRRLVHYEPGASLVTNRSVRYAGLDMGGRCWFVAREVVNRTEKRIVWAESIPLHQVGVRVPQLCAQLGISCTFIDQMPETSESRRLALKLNGLEGLQQFPRIPDTGQCHVGFHGGLAFVRDHNGDEKWTGLKAAVVRFDVRKLGNPMRIGADHFIGPNGNSICVPLVACNRMEAVDSVVREFLTPSEGELVPNQDGSTLQLPIIRVPSSNSDIWREFDEHHISGSERDKDEGGGLGDYVDGIANHLLFSNTYSRLAEVIGASSKPTPFSFGRGATVARSTGL